jgi:hypothetical protein
VPQVAVGKAVERVLAGEHADEPLADTVALGDLSSQILPSRWSTAVFRRGQVWIYPPGKGRAAPRAQIRSVDAGEHETPPGSFSSSIGRAAPAGRRSSARIRAQIRPELDLEVWDEETLLSLLRAQFGIHLDALTRRS